MKREFTRTEKSNAAKAAIEAIKAVSHHKTFTARTGKAIADALEMACPLYDETVSIIQRGYWRCVITGTEHFRKIEIANSARFHADSLSVFLDSTASHCKPARHWAEVLLAALPAYIEDDKRERESLENSVDVVTRLEMLANTVREAQDVIDDMRESAAKLVASLPVPESAKITGRNAPDFWRKPSQRLAIRFPLLFPKS